MPGTTLDSLRRYLLKEGFSEYTYQRVDKAHAHQFWYFTENSQFHHLYMRMQGPHMIRIFVFTPSEFKHAEVHQIFCISTRMEKLSFDNSFFYAHDLNYLRRALLRLYQLIAPKGAGLSSG